MLAFMTDFDRVSCTELLTVLNRMVNIGKMDGTGGVVTYWSARATECYERFDMNYTQMVQHYFYVTCSSHPAARHVLDALNMPQIPLHDKDLRKQHGLYNAYNCFEPFLVTEQCLESSDKPLYVININSENNTVVVGNKQNLEIKEIQLRELNILAPKEEFNKAISIKVRSTGRLLKAKINFLDKVANVKILDKETGISPGQACVFYSKDNFGDKVMGGGWIDKTFNNNLST